ncbi:XRE family transcriptional regulator [Candidatus Parcubacteria bacterium]|nr:MAG: XRE family transcriptional regulator [Candidatus Parcubacteria bacterium]
MKQQITRYQQIGLRLRLAREEAGLTQEEAALRLGKSQSYISRCETGKHRMDILELEAFSQLYAKTITFFLIQD